MVTNRRLLENEGPDFYPTPEWGTKALMDYVTFDGNILEPCCGDGAMSQVLGERYSVISSDKYDRGYGEVKDFFDYPYLSCNNIVTNPPFNIAENVLSHALGVATHKIALLLRLSFLESQRRYEKFFKSVYTQPCTVLVFSERLSMYPKGYPVKGGGTTSYAWFVWDRHKLIQAPKLEWIRPGFKDERIK